MSIRVACIGDSLTWGFTLPDPGRQSYPALLQEKLGADYIVRNFGCNGASVRFDTGLPYAQTMAGRESLTWNPDVVLIMFGSNDASPWDWNPDTFRRDYERLIASYRGLPSRPRIILIAPIRMFRVMGTTFMGLSPEIMEEGIRPAIHEIAKDNNLELIDLVNLFTDSRYCYDGVHPQSPGTRMIADAIYGRVEDLRQARSAVLL